MTIKTDIGNLTMSTLSRTLFGALLVALPVMASANWQLVVSEPGKRVEIDRSSILADPAGISMARARIVLDKPIVDPKTSASYRIIEVVNRYNCSERSLATLKRSYFKDEGDLLRQEDVRSPYDIPVRSGTPDDKMLREVCRPKTESEAVAVAAKTVEAANEAAGELRKINEALVAKEVKKDLQRLSTRARTALSGSGGAPTSGGAKRTAPLVSTLDWSYDGSGGPENWGKLKPEYAACASGHRQSPIDLRDGIAVDLEPIQFSYRPSSFRVVDTGRTLQTTVYGGGFGLLGKNYELIRVLFHRPAEFTVAGKNFDMDAQLVHKSEDGKLAIVTVLLEKGTENPVIQTMLNNLPLEKGSDVVPPTQTLDMNRLLPDNRRYFTFMGSLTTPPCTEEVQWLVFKQPQQLSPEQLSILQRLYPPNARPVQPTLGRIIKESR